MPAPVAGVDGAWGCPHCCNVNFKVRMVCNRCQTPRPQSSAEPAQHLAQVPPQPQNGSFQKGPVAGVDGNWACPQCQNVNFPGRTACNRCQAPKPAPTFTPQPTYAKGVGKGGPVAGVDGNWECPLCRNVNYRMREVCNKCQAAKPAENLYSEAAEAELIAQLQQPAPMVRSAPPRGSPPVAGVDGNWECATCTNVNLHWRQVCNLCQQPKPAEAFMDDLGLAAQLSQPAPAIANTPRRGPPQPGVDGNWSCPLCQNVNFGIRTACNKCQAPKPAETPPASTANDYAGYLSPAPTEVAPPRKGPQAGVDGNWACPYCKNVNFAYRTACNKCGASKPEESPQASSAPISEDEYYFQQLLDSTPVEASAPELTPEVSSQAQAPKRGPQVGVDGNWACPQCGNVNYAGRVVCNLCQTPKPDASPQAQWQPPQAPPQAPRRQAPQAGVDGNWACPRCQNVNFPMRMECNRCGEPKPAEGTLSSDDFAGYLSPKPTTPSAPQKGPPQVGVDGNWACLQCQNVNLGYRMVCNRCQTPKPSAPAPTQAAGPPQAGVDGNWACPQCQNVNFAYRMVCNRCQAPKPSAPAPTQPARRSYGGPVAGVDGNWQCLKCRNVNYAMRDTCNRCQEPKPPEYLLSDDDLFNHLSQPGPTMDGPPAKRPRF